MRSYWGRRFFLVGIAAALLGASMLGAGVLALDDPATGAGTGSGGDGSESIAGTAVQQETLGPPDWPSAPLDVQDVPGRSDVPETDTYPNSTVGLVGATGTLVSDYHVLTAAHVVTHRNGTPRDPRSLRFAPGFRDAPGERSVAPYGSANVVEVIVHPEWDGDPPDDDLALLVLDRPVGALAGSMALPDGEVWDAHSRDLRQVGYVRNVSGVRQTATRPRPRSSAVGSHDGYHYYCGPLSHGDSGSPVWTEVDGVPTILSVNSAFDSSSECDDAAVGVRLDAERTERIRRWMDRSDRPAPKADLVVATSEAGPPWVDARDVLPREPVGSRNATFALGTTVYNDGPRAVGYTTGDWDRDRATVEFVGVPAGRSPGSGPDDMASATPLCTSRVAVEAYEAVRANCSVDRLPPSLADASAIDVYAIVDPDDEIEEYERSAVASSDGLRFVGSVPLESDPARP